MTTTNKSNNIDRGRERERKEVLTNNFEFDTKTKFAIIETGYLTLVDS